MTFCAGGLHAMAVTYRRPWRRLFRRRHAIRCHLCDLRIEEP